MAEAKERKSIDKLMREKDKYWEFLHKIFVHKGDGEKYQLLFTAFDNVGNNIHAIYTLVAVPALKFTDPIDVFFEQFEPWQGDSKPPQRSRK